MEVTNEFRTPHMRLSDTIVKFEVFSFHLAATATSH